MYTQTLLLNFVQTFWVSRKMETTYEFGCIWKLIFINISVCAKLRHVENVFVAKYLWWNFICKQFYISNLRHNTRWFHQRFTQNKNKAQTFNSKKLGGWYLPISISLKSFLWGRSNFEYSCGRHKSFRFPSSQDTTEFCMCWVWRASATKVDFITSPIKDKKNRLIICFNTFIIAIVCFLQN